MLAGLARLSDRLLAVAAVLLVLAMLGAVFLGVVFRFLNQPLSWTDELGQYLLVWTGFVGLIIAGNRGSHIRVTVLLNRLSGRARQAAGIAIHLAVAAFGAVLLLRSQGLITRNLDVTWVTLPLSVALVYIPIPIAGFAIIVQSLVAILRDLGLVAPAAETAP
ncbi:TRAP transporter small permease [Acuticoccus sp. MNP-M23]|uniref:TRAP transporter small permease n=1 Tax=Acuticoccus sp. MNP-M23 TaxID=3072793 RepID=UPI00281659D3|nr:TRAP transporter small permease [Acuticoccus sp. MNP-M23]WMS43929.1 TRAP transporter small permease [Acuticoccus sp. MNP-M23]